MKYTFNLNNNNKNTFRNNNNWSKILDDIILSDVIKKNPYLKTKEESFIDSAIAAIKPATSLFDDHIIINNGTKKESSPEFMDAVKFLSTYNNNKHPYYTLSDGTPIVFFEDEIQIGFDLIPRDEFEGFFYKLPERKKKTIIDIYIKIRH